VHYLEIYGTIVVVISAIVFMNDSTSTKTNGQTNIFLGDIIGLSSSPTFAIYFIVSARLLKKLPAMVVLEVSFAIQLVLYFVFTISIMDTEKFYSFDPQFGILGWASNTYLMHSLLFVGTFTGLFGVGGYVFTLNFFPPHIVGNIFLLEPVFAQTLGCILGQDNPPGIITYLGITGITVGLGICIQGDLLRRKQTLQDLKTQKKSLKDDEANSIESSLIIKPED